MMAEQGHFLYPSPEAYAARYSYGPSQGSLMPAMNHGNSFAPTSGSEGGIAMGDFDMSSSYATDGTGYAAGRSKTSMADSSYAVMNPAVVFSDDILLHFRFCTILPLQLPGSSVLDDDNLQ